MTFFSDQSKAFIRPVQHHPVKIIMISIHEADLRKTEILSTQIKEHLKVFSLNNSLPFAISRHKPVTLSWRWRRKKFLLLKAFDVTLMSV